MSILIVDDLGRAVEELVTVITEQEIETTIEHETANSSSNVENSDRTSVEHSDY